MKKLFWCFCLLLCCLGCVACGPQQDKSSDRQNISVNNYNFFGDEQKVIFKQVPQRILVCGNSGVETLVALGAGDKITAAVLTEAEDKGRLQALLPNTRIYTQPLQLEAAVALQPDFILGWRRYFADNQLGDTSSWIANGIPAYIQDASGPVPAKGRFPACTIASEKRFISNMGLALGKQQQAQDIIQRIDAELQAVEKIPAQKVLFVEFLNGNIEVFGNDLLCGDIIRHYGCSLVSYSAPFISKEEMMEMQVAKIFIVYHGGEQQKQAALAQLHNPLYKHLPAVASGQVYPIAYKQIVAPGSDLLGTLKYIKQCLLANHPQ